MFSGKVLLILRTLEPLSLPKSNRFFSLFEIIWMAVKAAAWALAAAAGSL